MFVSHNGRLINADEARIPITNIAWTYGFGVYENLKVRNGKIFFVSEHVDRLLQSAEIIGLAHTLEKDEIQAWLYELQTANAAEAANIKMILVGGKTDADADLYIMTLAPKFIDKKVYREGVHTITKQYERFLPQAKTLNMLPSYLLLREAQTAGAHDCLLIHRDGYALEGTRSNFFAIKGRELFTAPKQHVLAGVTRHHVIECAQKNGYRLTPTPVLLDNIAAYDGAFLTHTSGNIVPIRSIHTFIFPNISQSIKHLIKCYDAYLNSFKHISM